MTSPTEGLLIARAEAFARPYYAAPDRAYHNPAHVQQVLGALASRGVLTPALSLAAWGHDLIYDPHAGDNEARSAAIFCVWLEEQGAGASLIEEVGALILATRHTAPPQTRAEALLADADLGILGSDPQAFATYDAAVR